MKWNKIDDSNVEAALDRIGKDSHKQAILCFKHSKRCAVSCGALGQFEADFDSSHNMTPYYIEVRAQRALSNALTERYQVAHASPQVMLIVKDTCIYTASHEAIQYSALVSALQGSDFHA